VEFGVHLPLMQFGEQPLSLAVIRGPVPLAKTLVAIDVLSGGRLVAALGPGSSEAD
jgi:alkanesulfonate monooxygenase SsuD/methylene tetrahydromethanopterin reductase-like flavin-dependent oxidoreductase (luciferase family)